MAADNPYAPVPSPPTPDSPDSYEGPVYVPSSTTATIIPYKNPKALVAYYLGILSGFPIIGLPLGIAAFVLGIRGLQERKRAPEIKGSVHAWIGIGCGGFFAILWMLVLGMVVIVNLVPP